MPWVKKKKKRNMKLMTFSWFWLWHVGAECRLGSIPLSSGVCSPSQPPFDAALVVRPPMTEHSLDFSMGPLSHHCVSESVWLIHESQGRTNTEPTVGCEWPLECLHTETPLIGLDGNLITEVVGEVAEVGARPSDFCTAFNSCKEIRGHTERNVLLEGPCGLLT